MLDSKATMIIFSFLFLKKNSIFSLIFYFSEYLLNMMENRNFYRDKEKEDWIAMQSFNSLLSLTQLGRTPVGTFYDVSGYTKDGTMVEIELKGRNISLNDLNNNPVYSEGIIVEAEKISDMLFDSNIEGTIPLYINFLNDNHIVVFNFKRFKKRPQRKKIRIKNQGEGVNEKVTRYYLPLDEGIIYRKEGDKYRKIN